MFAERRSARPRGGRALAAAALALASCGGGIATTATLGAADASAPPPPATAPQPLAPPSTAPPPPNATAVVVANVAARDLALRDGYAYFVSTGNGIARVPLGGGATEVVDASPTAGPLAGVDATSAYFFDVDVLVKVPVGGGARTTLAPWPESTYHATFVDDTYVYASTANKPPNPTANFSRFPLGGGPIEGLAQNIFVAIAGDASYVYTRRSDGPISKWDRTTKAIVEVPAYAGKEGAGLVVTGNHLYWADIDPSGAGVVRSALVTGRAVSDLATIPQPPIALATDGTNVFVATTHVIHEIATADGTTKTLVSGLHSPQWLAVDGSSLYFVDVIAEDGPILRTPVL